MRINVPNSCVNNAEKFASDNYDHECFHLAEYCTICMITSVTTCFITDAPDEIVVTWVTLSSTNLSVVEYGQQDLDSVAKGTQDVFKDGGSEKRNIYMHRVTLSKLLRDTRYSESRKHAEL